MDADVGLDGVTGPDGTDFKQLVGGEVKTEAKMSMSSFPPTAPGPPYGLAPRDPSEEESRNSRG